MAEVALDHVEGCDQIGVSLAREGRVETGNWIGDAVCEIDGAQYDTGVGPCLDALRHRRVFQVDDMAEDTRWPDFAEAARKRGIRSSLSVPLVAYDESLGALNLYGSTARSFGPEAHRSSALVARQAAAALANARAYDALVGGDWYDAVRSGDGGLSLTIGDVAGHGLPAAATMGRLRTALSLRVASAGHPPPLLLAPDGGATFLQLEPARPSAYRPPAPAPSST